MADIAPTATASTPEEYKAEINRVASFTKRIHIDLADGEFAPTKLINPAEVWWPEQLTADIHVMYQRPAEVLETLASMNPSLIVIHAEADGGLSGLLQQIKDFGIRAGIALLKPTNAESVDELIRLADHVLVFSGDLGYHGGTVDFELLDKVAEVKRLNPEAEIGWDGGITAESAAHLVDGGVDVLNVGGFIQQSDDPAGAYQQVVSALP